MDSPNCTNNLTFTNHPNSPMQPTNQNRFFPTHQPTMEITIYNDSTEHVLVVEPATPVHEVKIRMQQLLGIPLSLQSLWFMEQWLKNYSRLSDYHVTHGAKLSLYRGIPITVKAGPRLIHLMIDDAITVQALKERVHDESGISVDHMKLWYGTRKMKENCALWVYHIHEECEIVVDII